MADQGSDRTEPASSPLPQRWADGAGVAAVRAAVFAAGYPTWAELAATPAPRELNRADWIEALWLTRRAALEPSGLADSVGEPLWIGHPPALQSFYHALDRGLASAPPLDRDRDRRVARAQRREALAAAEGAGFPRAALTEAALRAGQVPTEPAGRAAANFLAARQLAHDFADSPLTPARLQELHTCLLSGLGTAAAVPPSGEAAENVGAKIYRFANGEEPAGFLHPFARAALLRYYVAGGGFFSAGNGRLAEILFGWSLRRAGYVRVEELALAEIVQRDPAATKRALARTAADRDATHWVLFLAAAWREAERVADDGRQADARERDAGIARWRGLSAGNVRQQALLLRALAAPETEFVIAAHQRSHRITHETARLDLFDLEARGWLSAQRRGRVYYFRAVPDLEARLSGRAAPARTVPQVSDDEMPVNLL